MRWQGTWFKPYRPSYYTSRAKTTRPSYKCRISFCTCFTTSLDFFTTWLVYRLLPFKTNTSNHDIDLVACLFNAKTGQGNEPSLAHGKLNCFTWGYKVCEVHCDTGFVPERPHAGSYLYNHTSNQWITYPLGYEFPPADCVKPGSIPLTRFLNVSYNKWQKCWHIVELTTIFCKTDSFHPPPPPTFTIHLLPTNVVDCFGKSFTAIIQHWMGVRRYFCRVGVVNFINLRRHHYGRKNAMLSHCQWQCNYFCHLVYVRKTPWAFHCCRG